MEPKTQPKTQPCFTCRSTLLPLRRLKHAPPPPKNDIPSPLGKFPRDHIPREKRIEKNHHMGRLPKTPSTPWSPQFGPLLGKNLSSKPSSSNPSYSNSPIPHLQSALKIFFLIPPRSIPRHRSAVKINQPFPQKKMKKPDSPILGKFF